MARTNIFNLLTISNNLEKEYERIRRLTEDEWIVGFCENRDIPKYFSLYEYVEDHGFNNWKNKQFCIDFEDYVDTINLSNIEKEAQDTIEGYLTYIELISNFWYMAENDIILNKFENFYLLKSLIDNSLSKYNHKVVYIPEEEMALVIEDKSEVTAVAESVEPEMAHTVLRYNHHNLKGDLQSKKNILLSMYAALEPKRNSLKSINKSLEDNISYIMNNLNLRHNNTVSNNKNYRKVVDQMTSEELESWYDEVYQSMLLAFLELDQQERNVRIHNLKNMIN